VDGSFEALVELLGLGPAIGVLVVLVLVYLLYRAFSSQNPVSAEPSRPREPAAELFEHARRLGLEGVAPDGERVRGTLHERSVTLSLSDDDDVEIALGEVDRAPRIDFRSKAAPGEGDFLDCGRFVARTPDARLLVRSLEKDAQLATAVADSFEPGDARWITIESGTLRACVPRRSLARTSGARLLETLGAIADSFERRGLEVAVLGGERRALGSGGSVRCAYCHGGITGDEPDLVACRRCQTVLHEGCWSELGRCPLLGCAGLEPERGPSRAS
jgi:hypothetical protein